ncbi:MAG: peptidoglycan editing factor PgeF [Oscillospiraceae bacterium]|nr:peptidoglycan editing factor PgeF [Oscillospiraceae bacterium]
MDIIERSQGALRWLTCRALDEAGVVNAFTTRLGGVSSGEFESLNLAVSRGDDRDCVRSNYGIISLALGISPASLAFSRQVHGDAVRAVTSADIKKDLFDPVPYEADGLMTDERGVSLIIHIADCEGILLYCRKPEAVAAVHAGWRGTVADIAGKAVAAMQREYGCDPGDMVAALAPCASVCCYEVGPEVVEAVERLPIDVKDLVVPTRDGHAKIDIKGINAALLRRAGVRDIYVSPDCTMCLPDKYWSHRITAGRRGAQACIIALK